MSNLYAIYFSATDTTSLCVNYICQGLGLKPTSTINLADGFDVDFPNFTSEDIVIVAAPVYGGRIPERVAESFAKLKEVFPNKTIETIDYNDVALTGGILNCTTWVIRE